MLFNFEKSKRSALNPFLLVNNIFDESFFSNLNMEMESKLIGNMTMGGRINNEFLPKNYDSKKYKSWHQLYKYLNSSELRNHLQQEYSSDLEYWGANIDFLNPSLKPVIHMATSWDGYWREAHFDTEGRLWSFIIFFNDKQWDGGDLNLHDDSNVAFHIPRYFLKKLPIMNVVEAKENRGVFWISSPNSYHSVSLQHNTIENRKFIYGSLCFQGKAFNRRLVIKANIINLLTDLINYFYYYIRTKIFDSSGRLRLIKKLRRFFMEKPGQR